MHTEDSIQPSEEEPKEEVAAIVQCDSAPHHHHHAFHALQGLPSSMLLDEAAMLAPQLVQDPLRVGMSHGAYLPDRNMAGEFVYESWFYLHQKLIRTSEVQPPDSCLLLPASGS